uniref:Uncharacterized protein n=1 Tax=Timema monikensis TaxID=170555 RepID=A0A7R9EA07_9NEOP|nr:unnamed protein product [Timema monikensis]
MIHKVFNAMTPWKDSDAGPVPRVWWATEDNVRCLMDVIATHVIVILRHGEHMLSVSSGWIDSSSILSPIRLTLIHLTRSVEPSHAVTRIDREGAMGFPWRQYVGPTRIDIEVIAPGNGLWNRKPGVSLAAQQDESRQE